MNDQRAKLSRDVVEAARRAVESGITIADTARHLGVDYEALKKRAHRGGWLTPRTIQRATAARITEQATDIVAASRAERASRYEEKLSTAAERFADKAAGMAADELIARARAIETLDKVSRRALGLDVPAEGNNVNIALLSQIFENQPGGPPR
jgi:transposase-like protein